MNFLTGLDMFHKKISKKYKLACDQAELYKTTFEYANESMVIFDKSGRVVDVNPKAASYLEMKPKEIVGMGIYELFPEASKGGEGEKLSSAFKDLMEGVDVKPFYGSIGKTHHKCNLIRFNPNGNDYGLCISTDVTEIEQKNQELKIANRQMSEFVSVVSHDFGNPLGIIMGNTEMALMGVYGELTPKLKKKLGTVLETSKRLNKLRIDTFDLSKLKLGKLEILKTDGDIYEFTHLIVGEHLIQSEKNNQTISVDCPESGLSIEFDRNQLHRVYDNYLSNASRYSPDGGEIQVGVKIIDEDVIVSVKDNGRGLPQEELENIFKPFYRTGTCVKGSTGLGLSIVDGIMKAHGGKAWAESEGEGKGSTFYFSLPYETPDKEDEK